VVAEQIAWQKAKGQNVGRKLPLAASLRKLLDRPFVCGFKRQGKGWDNWTATGATGLAELLDYDRQPGRGIRIPPEGAILCASLATRAGLLGILKIASIHPGAFCRYEVELISQFLPPTQMELPGLSIAARYLACNELAGDIYDYVEAGDGAVAVLIADVVGHGTSAAMMTGVVKAAFRASHVDGFEPMAVVDRVKEGIRDFDPSRFVTLCCARVDPRRGELRYVNAGHPEPIIRSGAARPILLDSTGPILSSALFDIPCEQATAALGPGDSLLLYNRRRDRVSRPRRDVRTGAADRRDPGRPPRRRPARRSAFRGRRLLEFAQQPG